jgi:hypothetical protein
MQFLCEIIKKSFMKSAGESMTLPLIIPKADCEHIDNAINRSEDVTHDTGNGAENNVIHHISTKKRFISGGAMGSFSLPPTLRMASV